MSSDVRPCPICKLENARLVKIAGSEPYEIKCKRCGSFMMEGILLRIIEKGPLSEEDGHLLPYLSSHTRQATENGITSEFGRDNWRDLARAHTTTSVSQKVTKLLELVASRSAYPGARVLVDAGLDYPLLDATSDDEVNYPPESTDKGVKIAFRPITTGFRMMPPFHPLGESLNSGKIAEGSMNAEQN